MHEIHDGEDCVQVAKGKLDAFNGGVVDAVILYIHRNCYHQFIKDEEVMAKRDKLILDLIVMLREKKNLAVGYNQLLSVENLTDLMNCVREDVPIELEWVVKYSGAVYDETSEGAVCFVRDNKDCLDFDEVIWNLVWRKT